MEKPPRANHFPRESIDSSTSVLSKSAGHSRSNVAGKSPINGDVDGFPASHVADCWRVSPFLLVNRKKPLSPHFFMALLQQTIKTTWKRRCPVRNIIYFHGAFSISTCLSLWNCWLSIYIYILILYTHTNIALCLKMWVYTHFTYYGFCGDITHHIISLQVITLYSSMIAQWELYIPLKIAFVSYPIFSAIFSSFTYPWYPLMGNWAVFQDACVVLPWVPWVAGRAILHQGTWSLGHWAIGGMDRFIIRIHVLLSYVCIIYIERERVSTIILNYKHINVVCMCVHMHMWDFCEYICICKWTWQYLHILDTYILTN